MSVSLYFPDESTLSGKDATDVLLAWGRLQWTSVDSLVMIRTALAHRAWVWSRTAIDSDLPPDEFLTALDGSGLCTVVWDGTPAKPRDKGT